MLTLWFDPNNIIRREELKFRTTILNPYQITYKEKTLGADQIDPNDINVLIVPVLSDVLDFQYSGAVALIIQLATDKGIQCYLDYSWEFLNINSEHWFRSGSGDLLDNLDHMREHNVKIITNFEDYRSAELKFDHMITHLDEFIVRFDQFKYDTRINHIQMKRDNRLFKMDSHYTARKNKKYNFTALCGSVAKKQNSLLFAGLHRAGLLNGTNFWTIINNVRDQDIHGRWTKDPKVVEQLIRAEDPIFKYFFDNKDKILVERFHEEESATDFELGYEYVPTHRERRIPQQYYDSHFSLTIETCMSRAFFTEKTYKPVSIGLPFLIYGSPYQNTVFKDTYGYEIFEEVWDYSFERPFGEGIFSAAMSGTFWWENMVSMTNGYIAEIDRMAEESDTIFYQPSVIEKTEHNRELFEKTTTRKALLVDLSRLFGEGDYN